MDYEVMVLAGKTTTVRQLERCLKSLSWLPDRARVWITVNSDDKREVAEKCDLPCGYSVLKVPYDEDSGDARNEFIEFLLDLYGREGLNESGAYVMFVDGDDEVTIHRGLPEKDEGDVLVSTSVFREDAAGYLKPVYDKVEKMEPTVYGYTRALYSDELGGQCWGKLYKLSLLKSTCARFEKGMYEDLVFQYRLVHGISSCMESAKVTKDDYFGYVWHVNKKGIQARDLTDDDIKNRFLNLRLLERYREKVEDPMLDGYERSFRFALGYCMIVNRISDGQVTTVNEMVKGVGKLDLNAVKRLNFTMYTRIERCLTVAKMTFPDLDMQFIA